MKPPLLQRNHASALQLPAARSERGAGAAGIRRKAWSRSRYVQLRIAGEAADGRESIRCIAELMPDLVLLDISLPTVNGIEVLKHIAKTVSTAKVLLLSNNTDLSVVDWAMRNGACGYVFKVDAGRDLLLAIDAVLRGQKFFSRNLQRAPVENNSLGPVRRPD